MKKLHTLAWLIAILILVFLVSACAGEPNNEQQADVIRASNEDQSLDEQLGGEQDADDENEESVQQGEQQRDPEVDALLEQFAGLQSPQVIPLSVAMSELLNELGIMPVGVPSSSMNLPDAYVDLPRVGSTIQPDLEQLVALQPDVILIPESLKDSLGAKLEPTAIPLAYLPVDSLDEMKLTLRVLSVLFDKEAEAEQFLAAFAAEEQQIIAAYEEQEAPKVMFLFGSTESLMFMNENTYAGSLARNLGAINVVSDILNVKETYAPLDMESIVEVNPDIIFLIAHGDPVAVASNFEADIKNNGVWEKLSAFQNNKMKALQYDLFGSASLTKAISAYYEMIEVLYDN